MAMNKYMHPRNIYKTVPDFKQIAVEFPEFREFVKQDLNGNVHLDFKDLKSLRALSCVLLKKDFDLNVEIPLNKLIPTIPLRLNYILWLEDLLSITGKLSNIKGIDIGTGAACIYPLLAARKNKWSIIATEKDIDSYTYAKDNIERNSLQSLIKLVKVQSDKLLEDVVEDDYYDFCMCNPPFFSSTQELHPFFKSRKSNRPHPKNAFCASVDEVVHKGGEIEFISKIITESKVLRKNIKIYSTMVGHKNNLPALKKLLREIGVSNFKETEFCQGNTTRWGLAWTFYEDLDLRKAPDPVKEANRCFKPKPPLTYTISLVDTNEYSLNSVREKIFNLFKELQLVTENITRNKTVLRYVVTAFSNTWSHQRRQKREKIKVLHNNSVNDSEINICKNSTSDNIRNEKIVNNISINNGIKSPGKRINDNVLEESLLKKLKISTETNCKATPYFKFITTIKLDKSNISLELSCVEEFNNREQLHQILQYIKNNLKL